MSFATVAIDGRLTRDPEVKDVGSGTVTSFTLACDQYNGPNKEKTAQFWDCECWSPAQKVLEYVRKGDPLAITGQLRQDKVPPKGELPARTFYKVRVENVGNLPPKGSSDGERIRKESKQEDEDLF